MTLHLHFVEELDVRPAVAPHENRRWYARMLRDGIFALTIYSDTKALGLVTAPVRVSTIMMPSSKLET